ncbi:peptide/nickel transport system permease protein [Nakamurella sp. UYEF19]|uniref:ABC transporter permease n=1 Tax=Nakamurella sp. UYEF19 TaxID=1756392 RepID=UPI003391FCAB
MTEHISPDPSHDVVPTEPGERGSLEQREVAGLSQSQIVRKRFFRHRGAVISLTVLVLILLLSVSSIGYGPIPGWWQHNYYDVVAPADGARATLSVFWIGGHDFFSMGAYPFGADGQHGQDNFAQVMRGIQQTLTLVVITGILSTVLGVVLGAIAGYYRGWVDSVIMRFTDLIITLPVLLVTAVLGFVFEARGVIPVAVALGLLSWTSMTRLVRAEFLTLREREFVDAAKVAGASSARIIFKHIMPNSVGVIVVNATLTISSSILVEAALSFLSFGIQYPDVSLGSLISTYQASILTGEPYLFFWPGIFIILIVLCLNFIGDGLRDAYDPRQKRIPKARDLRRSKALARTTLDPVEA